MPNFDASLVRQAFVYAQPLAEVYRQWALQQATQGPMNRLMAFRNLADASFRTVPSPNTDTMYTVFGFDLSDGPVVMQAPAIPEDRYFVLPFYDAFTNVFASFGTRTQRYGPFNFLITPPGYDGEVPDGLTQLESPSLIGSMLGRILIYSEDDVPAVRSIQDEFVVAPLSEWSAGNHVPLVDFEHPEPVEGFTFFDSRDDAEGFWKGVGHAVAGTNIPEHDRDLFASFAPLGLTSSGFVPPADAADRELLYAETETSWKFLADFAADQSQAESLGVSFFNSNGWGWSASVRDADNTGALFYGDQYLLRAWVNYLYYGMLPPDEALYPAVYADSDGVRLNGDHVYTWTVRADQRPVHELGFTSLTLYRMDGYFYDNPERVYKIGDRDPDLVTDESGNINITVSAQRPENVDNWLPSPAGEDFYLMFRTYLPAERVLDGTYEFTPVRRIGR